LLHPEMMPGREQLSGTLLRTGLRLSVTALPPLAKMPPPSAAELPVTWVSWRLSGPPGGPRLSSGLTPSSRMPPPIPDAELPVT
jgi:hypothetical protein